MGRGGRGRWGHGEGVGVAWCPLRFLVLSLWLATTVFYHVEIMMGSKKYGRAFFFLGKREREDVHPLGIMEWNSYGCGSACVYLSDLGL